MRLTVRSILVNKNTNKILFIKYVDNKSESTKRLSNGFWVMPGGGLKKKETFEEALIREVFEETGIVDIVIKRCVLSRILHANLRNIKENFYYERYYLVETKVIDIRNDYITESEKETIKEYKWWSIDELKQTNETIFPDQLVSCLDKALNNNGCPIDITNPQSFLI